MIKVLIFSFSIFVEFSELMENFVFTFYMHFW